MTPSLRALARFAVLPVVLACVGHAALRATPEDARIVSHWNAAFLDAIRHESTAPCLASRNLAILHLAMFDAANAVEQRYPPFHYTRPAPHGLDARVAAIAAARLLGRSLYPSQADRFDELAESQRLRFQDPAARSDRFGRQIAETYLALRANDGSARAVTYIPRDAIGQWNRTPPSFKPPEMPQWPDVQPFAISDASAFAPPGPPPLDSPAYAEALDEVRRLGARDSASRTDEQALLADFWSCFTYTATPAGHWNEIAARLLIERDLDFHEALRLMAALNAAMADAGIVGWRSKYQTHLWRPIHAIRNADSDGNAYTEGDPRWESLLESPPHPEYVSGHSVFSGSGAEVLRQFFGTDRIAFVATSDSLPGVQRSYLSLSECEREIAMSRVYGGIHYRFSAEHGLALGHAVAREVLLKRFPSQPR